VRRRLSLASSLLGSAGLACTSISTVHLPPGTVDVGPGRRAIAAIQADATSAYILFVPIPGVDLDRVLNQMLIARARSLGADKVADVRFEITPDTGVWAWRKLLGWRSGRATAIAVQLTEPAAPDEPALPTAPPIAPPGAAPQ
jgi:hypothetical protein